MSDNNVFIRIIKGELPCSKVYEDDQVLAFKDINPQAPTHIIIIPKKEYRDYNDFMTRAQPSEVLHLFQKTNEIIELLKLQGNFRIITNAGADSGQTVYHFHMHLISGAVLHNLV